MTVMSYAESALSLLPPVVAIVLAILTRRVLVSLGLGIVAGILLLSDFSPLDACLLLGERVVALVWSDGAPNSWNLYILGFLVLLGMITALISASGAARAFADWARVRIRTKRDAQLLTLFLGCVVFIDDYFNSLVVGSIARPLTDRYYVSRAKLAYLLDSTAAPVCVISPVSSWGAYIIALIGGILASHGISDTGHLAVFIQLIPMNFYAIFALALLLCVVLFGLDVGAMRRHEQDALRGNLYDETKGVPPGSNVELPEEGSGKVAGLFVPIGVLVLATVSFMIGSGAMALADAGLPFSLIGAFEKTDVGASLFFGALLGLSATLALVLWQGMAPRLVKHAAVQGARSMVPALYILLFAWTIAGIIGELGTGKYMASLAGGNLPFALLPALMFVLAGLTAFATGTSWGTFGIMLPIAADMAMGSHSAMMLPMLASVLAGAVFGDHCSPISDTTILSSTGASCHHIDHVLTQLPYALIVAIISLVGYTVMGMIESVWAGFGAASLTFVVAVLWLKHKSGARD
ncbi:Na+/H+ antiporter NhaC family protein [Shewanella sedimentimangrovi]|uniref:Na+/H+ antiporter NhaC family protein n=1 Tax=Shewanella sedimentimangrovi TaxID=2814293 RepID=A0ABX7R3P0_9GAMM|nr:Na+/H+ antiporter NhaC family protein [Shewanella sedimentimangrovi]QSX38334.1 Na+/H+ antiporter NhaC family protein [Shewanella sedimentimangrovi]